MEDFYVYILLCKDNSYYVGHTNNIEARISAHRLGGYCKYTSSRLPIKVVFVQQFTTRLDAFRMERQVKGWSRAKKIALIHGDWNELQKLAKCRDKKTDKDC